MNSGLKASPKALPGSFPGRLDEAWQNDVARRAGKHCGANHYLMARRL